VLANFLAHTCGASIVITHAFRASTDELSTRSNTLVASAFIRLLHHLEVKLGILATHEVVVTHVLPLLSRASSCHGCPFGPLGDVLEELVVRCTDVSLVIDGLDECQTSDNFPELLKLLRRLAGLQNAQVIVTSRLSSEDEDQLQVSTRLAMDVDTVSPDVMRYIRGMLSRDTRLALAKDDIIRHAYEHANGMFLWAKLMLEHVAKASTLAQIRTRLTGFPRQLSSIYERLLFERGLELDVDQLTLRKSIFMLVTVAMTPLTLEDLSTALALKASNADPVDQDRLLEPGRDISRLCYPLVSIKGLTAQLIHLSVKEFLLCGRSNETPQSPQSSLKQCHAYIALKCLYRMINFRFETVQIVQPLLEANFNTDGRCDEQNYEPCSSTSFLAYAYRNWYRHVMAASPTEKLLLLVHQFLRSQAFVTWSEAITVSNHDINLVLEVRSQLQSWWAGLNPSQQMRVQIEGYFAQPYIALHKSLIGKAEGTPLLPNLVLQRLGTFYNYSGEISEGRNALQVRESVAHGLSQVLGDNHVSTMRARTEHAVELVVHGQYPEAEAIFLRNRDLQLLHCGRETRDSCFNLEYAALAMYYQNRFAESETHLIEACESLRRTVGFADIEHQTARLYLGRTIEAQDRLQDALAIFESALETWGSLRGTENGLCLHIQGNISVVLRKLGRHDEAIKQVEEVLAHRQRMFGRLNFATVDSAINAAILFYECDKLEHADAHLDLVDIDSREVKFERVCQVHHMRAMLEMKRKRLGEATRILRMVLEQADAGQTPLCRELLWIRLTLAFVLRATGRPEEAASVFADTVVPADSRQMDLNWRMVCSRVAETAAEQARKHDFASADKVLHDAGMAWRSKKMLWIMVGGPTAETTAVGPSTSAQ
jgi:tetratricopeptide (TPR) repeat protein